MAGLLLECLLGLFFESLLRPAAARLKHADVGGARLHVARDGCVLVVELEQGGERGRGVRAGHGPALVAVVAGAAADSLLLDDASGSGGGRKQVVFVQTGEGLVQLLLRGRRVRSKLRVLLLMLLVVVVVVLRRSARGYLVCI